jgi:hypothetical protein
MAVGEVMGRFRKYLEPIPVHLVLDQDVAFAGLRDQRIPSPVKWCAYFPRTRTALGAGQANLRAPVRLFTL